MTIHIKTRDFECSKCGAVFIPYKKELGCPGCGKDTDEDISECFNFIDRLAGSMKIHKKRYGRYFPDAWFTGSMSDHIQSLIFRIFDSMEYYSEKGKEKEFISRFADEIKWKRGHDSQEYLKDYIKGIAFEVLDIYKKEDFKSIKMEKMFLDLEEGNLPQPSLFELIKERLKEIIS